MKHQTQEAIKQATEALSALAKGLDRLKASKKGDLKDLLEDATAKRFEVAFEYVWKLFKIAAEEQGTEAPGPKPAIAAAFRYRWIGKQIDLWQFFLEARNSGVHHYYAIPKREYMAALRDFVTHARAAIKTIQKLT